MKSMKDHPWGSADQCLLMYGEWRQFKCEKWRLASVSPARFRDVFSLVQSFCSRLVLLHASKSRPL